MYVWRKNHYRFFPLGGKKNNGAETPNICMYVMAPRSGKKTGGFAETPKNMDGLDGAAVRKKHMGFGGVEKSSLINCARESIKRDC